VQHHLQSLCCFSSLGSAASVLVTVASIHIAACNVYIHALLSAVPSGHDEEYTDEYDDSNGALLVLSQEPVVVDVESLTTPLCQRNSMGFDKDS
jgi:hypothetical protein